VTAPPAVELKRMYVLPSHRGTGVAGSLVRAVDHAAADLGAGQVVLQTGDRQPDAVRLYERHGYQRVPLFEPYLDLSYSICCAKSLAPR
jgi:GNAT superfamily N-acetyltransferase